MRKLQLGIIAWLIGYQEQIISLLWDSKYYIWDFKSVPFSRYILSKAFLNGQRLCVYKYKHRDMEGYWSEIFLIITEFVVQIKVKPDGYQMFLAIYTST